MVSVVRQGSVLSPSLFHKHFIVQLRQHDVNCHINLLFIGCLLYVDDMLLLGPSVIGMFDLCSLLYRSAAQYVRFLLQ